MIMDILSKPTLSDELIAAFVDGRTTPKETQQVLRAMLTDEEVRDLIEYMIRDNDMGDIEDECEDGQTVSVSPLPVQTNKTTSLSETQLPMAKMAAKSEENLCGVRCEEFIMYKRNIPFDDCELIQIAKANNWLRKDGVPLFYIGELLARKGYYVMRRYESNLDDIKRAILEKENVIVAVNSEILYDKKDHKKTEPNHAVVVLSVGPDTVTIFEPLNKFEERIQVPLAKFMLSWEASHCYMVKIFTNPEGKPLKPDSVSSWFSKFMKQHPEIPFITLHSLRHTNATLQLAAGVPITTVSKRLGHSNTATTGRVYAHAIQSADDTAAEKIEDIFSKQKTKAAV